MKTLLSIETTGLHLEVALYGFDQQKRSIQFMGQSGSRKALKQSELLIPSIDQLLRRCKIGKKNISLVAVDVGPGSFTGIRVGVAAARMLAQALEIPLIGVNSLEALAYWEKPKSQIISLL